MATAVGRDPVTRRGGDVRGGMGHGLLLLQLRNPLTEVGDLTLEPRDLFAELRDGGLGAGELGGLGGFGGQERPLALMADRETVRLELADGVASHGHGDAVRRLEVCQGRQLARLRELSGRDPPPQLLGYLLVGGLAGPLDHLHLMSLSSHCLSVPKWHRES